MHALRARLRVTTSIAPVTPHQIASVACVLDHGGGSRIVISETGNDFRAHVGEGERAIVVPDLIVEYPPRFEQYHEIVCRAEAEGKRHTNHHRFST